VAAQQAPTSPHIILVLICLLTWGMANCRGWGEGREGFVCGHLGVWGGGAMKRILAAEGAGGAACHVSNTQPALPTCRHAPP